MHPVEIDAILKLAKTALRGGRVRQAETMYRQVLGAEPNCPEAIHFLGVVAMRHRQHNKALQLVTQSIGLESGRADFYNNLSTLLRHMKRMPEALGAVERAIELQPHARAFTNKGLALKKLGRVDEAIDAYRAALKLRPEHAEAVKLLGNALSRKSENAEALRHLGRLTELRPRDWQARRDLGHALQRAGRPAEAVLAYRAAAELEPGEADAHNGLGAALLMCGRVCEAEGALRRCLSIDADHVDGHWNLGLTLLTKGQWRQGWIEYEWRRHLSQDGAFESDFRQPPWNGGPLDQATVLVLCEQGLGDTLQFIRYVPLMVRRGANVIIECASRLVPLLEQMGSSTGSSDAGRIKVIARGEPLPPFDMHVRLMSLPGIFGSMPDNLPSEVPYLQADPARMARCKERLGSNDGLRIGIVWQGSTMNRTDPFRSMPLEMLAPLAQVEGVRFVSLQSGVGSEQLEKHVAAFNFIEWSDPADVTRDTLEDTAAMIKNLDLVISVDTSLAHLAGALAVPVWVTLSAGCDWRWLLERTDTPWYPTMRLFRQKRLGDWKPVIDQMAQELRAKVAAASAR